MLIELGCTAPVVPVLNKCDLVPELETLPMIGNGVRISAATGDGIPALLEEVERILQLGPVQAELLLPFSKSGLAAKIRETGVILQEEYRADGLWMKAQLPPQLARRDGSLSDNKQGQRMAENHLLALCVLFAKFDDII